MDDSVYLDVLEDLEQAQNSEGAEDTNASKSFCGHIHYLTQVQILSLAITDRCRV